MTIIEAIIERAMDGTYTVYCKDEIFSGAGATIEEAKTDMLDQMTFYRQTALTEGFKYPAFLDEDFELSYQIDARSLIQYYVASGVFSLAGLEKVTGINQKQLWSYLNGRKPQNRQADRIRSGLLKLSKDLDAVFAQ